MADPNSSSLSPAAVAGPQGAEVLPLFYKKPRPLDRERDKDLHISRPKDFRFAEKTNAIPLLADEFPMAAAWFPIVFASGPTPVPAVVVGLNADSNLAIDPATGQWREGAYIPAYVRRYPFILMDDPDHKQFVLCLDEETDMIGPQGEFSLFEKGEPTPFTQGVIEFCGLLKQQGDATEEFVKALQEHQLLIPGDQIPGLPEGAKMPVTGFLVVDPRKFEALPDNVFLTWRRKGWAGFVYAHMLSAQRWVNLALLDQEVRTKK